MISIIGIILLVALIAALVKPEKVLPFIKTSNTIRRILAVIAYLVLLAIVMNIWSKTDNFKETVAEANAQNNQKWTEHAVMDSTHMANGYFSADSSKSTLELAAKFEELAAITAKSDYKKDEITDSAVIMFANRNSNTALELTANLQKSYRARYAELLGKELWENNIKVHTSNGGKTITFVGGMFANNKNIADFQKKIYGNLYAYGFEKSLYKWIEHDPEIVEYKVE